RLPLRSTSFPYTTLFRSSNEVPRRAHLVAVATRSTIRQSGLVGSGLRRGVQDPQPSRRCGAVVRAQHVVLLALDLADEEPADVLVGRPLDGAVVARARERHVRQDTLIYDALDPA